MRGQLFRCPISASNLPLSRQAARTAQPGSPQAAPPGRAPHLSEPLQQHSNLSKMQSFSYREQSLLRRYSCTLRKPQQSQKAPCAAVAPSLRGGLTWWVSTGRLSMLRSHTFTDR